MQIKNKNIIFFLIFKYSVVFTLYFDDLFSLHLLRSLFIYNSACEEFWIIKLNSELHNIT